MPASVEFWRDAAMPHVESRRACRSRACYKPHSHPSFSVGAVDEGRSLFSGAGKAVTRLQPGSVVFVPPHQVHACNPEPGASWSYQMLHLDAGWVQALWRSHSPQYAGGVYVSTSAEMYARFCALNRLLFSAAAVADKEMALAGFMRDSLALAQSAAQALAAQPAPDVGAAAIPGLLEAGLAGGVDWEAVAAMAGLSRYQLIRRFRTATGMTPHAWLLNRRINAARAQIRDGESIAQLAYALGFADQAHFQRVFKDYTGTTPGRYRG